MIGSIAQLYVERVPMKVVMGAKTVFLSCPLQEISIEIYIFGHSICCTYEAEISAGWQQCWLEGRKHVSGPYRKFFPRRGKQQAPPRPGFLLGLHLALSGRYLSLLPIISSLHEYCCI
jgi:hypothetical protein